MQIAAEPLAGKHADRTRHAQGIVAGVLQRLPGAFEEQALLGIQELGLARAVAEEAGVEQLHPVEHPGGRHVAGVSPQLGSDAGGGEPSSLKRAVEETPAHRLAHRDPTPGAPGKRPVRPTMAIAPLADADPPAARSAGSVTATRPGSRWRARARTVVWVRRSSRLTSRPSRSRSSACTRVSRSECPPRSKKFSSTPTRDTPKTSHQTPATESSSALLPSSGGRSRETGVGAGRALRSTLPLAVNGNAASGTNAVGTMAPGSRSRKELRSSSIAASPTT